MINLRNIWSFFILVLALPALSGQSVQMNGKAIGWTTVNPAEPFQIQSGLRYIPAIQFNIPVGKLSLEGEGSLNIRGSVTHSGSDSLLWYKKITPYRGWIKLSGDQFEVRAGLQKINFGSAQLLRPLMWFDQMDPNDPLRLTNGVYGVLGRYYFLNNAGIWAWALYGNNERKGFERYPTLKRTIEYGGRIQVPVPAGEAALTAHHRLGGDPAYPDGVPENRIAFDLKIDVGVGLWFEGSLTGQKPENQPGPSYTTLLTGGADYTIGVGNGINLIGEYFFTEGETPDNIPYKMGFSGVSVSYPINMIHSISGIAFYSFSTNDLYRFINWSMVFDRWTFYTMAFWNPENYQLPGFGLQQENNLFGGVGFQLMAVFNH